MNVTITGLDFPFRFFSRESEDLRNILNRYLIGSPIDSFDTSITRWSVFLLDSSSRPCNRRQYWRGYCFFLSIAESKSPNLLLRALIFPFSSFISYSFSCLASSYSWNISLITLTESCRSVSCVMPIIGFS